MTLTSQDHYDSLRNPPMPRRAADTAKASLLAGKAKAAFDRKAGPRAADLLEQAIDAGRGQGLNGSPTALRREYNTLAANQIWARLQSLGNGNRRKKEALKLHRYARASGGFRQASGKLEFTLPEFTATYNATLSLNERKQAKKTRKPAMF